MKNWFVIAVFMVAACTTDRKPAEDEQMYVVCFDRWCELDDKLDYFKELLDLQDSAMVGSDISITHLQALMPQNEVDFMVFMATEHYAFIEVNGEKQESPKALYLIAGEMAAADTLDMMSMYLKWFDWCDGWTTETVWDKAVEIEKRHPKKFHRLMQTSEWYGDWQDFRNEILEYEKESE